MWTLHPSCIHLFRWSLKRSVKRPWTGSTFPPMRVLEAQWSRALSLVYEVALSVFRTLLINSLEVDI